MPKPVANSLPDVHICWREQQVYFSICSVSACSANTLVVVLQRLRHPDKNDTSYLVQQFSAAMEVPSKYIGFVDPHPEGRGCNYALNFVTLPLLLDTLTSCPILTVLVLTLLVSVLPLQQHRAGFGVGYCTHSRICLTDSTTDTCQSLRADSASASNWSTDSSIVAWSACS